MTKPILSQ
jgi:hypothetical protein